MVDLVKIRKKAKEKSEKSEKASSRRVDESPSDSLPPHADSSSDSSSTTRRLDDSTPRSEAAREGKLERFKQQAGKRRQAEETHEETEEVRDENRLELLTFVIAGEQYAVDIERIVEIVTPRRVTRIPNAESSVVGIVSLRGTIVTLVDVRRKLGHAAAPPADAETRVVIVDLHNEMVGFLVDRVLRVVKTAADTLEPHPVVHSTELDDSIRGVFSSGGALTILLDLEKLLDHRGVAAKSA